MTSSGNHQVHDTALSGTRLSGTRQTWLRSSQAVTIALLVQGCAPTPQELPARLHSALLRHDTAATLQLVSRASQPLLQAALMVNPPGQPPYWLASAGAAAEPHVLSVDQDEASLRMTVEVNGTKRQWILVQEQGAWKLDLAATASARTWSQL